MCKPVINNKSTPPEQNVKWRNVVRNSCKEWDVLAPKGFKASPGLTDCVVTLGLPRCWQPIQGWEYHQNSHFNWLSDEEIQFSAILPCQDLRLKGRKGKQEKKTWWGEKDASWWKVSVKDKTSTLLGKYWFLTKLPGTGFWTPVYGQRMQN